MYVVTVQSRFRGSVNCGALSMENSFQVANFSFKVQNGPGVIWVACIGLSERSKCSLRCASAFLGAFWTVSNTWDTQLQQAVRMKFSKYHGIWLFMQKILHTGDTESLDRCR